MRGSDPGPGRLHRITKNGRQVWQADFVSASGRRRRVIVGESRRAAELELARLIRERDIELLDQQSRAGSALPGRAPAPLPPASGPDVLLSEIFETYLAHLRTYAQPRTVHDAEVVLRRVLAETGARTLGELTRARVVAWRGRLVTEGLAHKSANTAVGTLRTALGHAVHLGMIDDNPVSGLQGLKVGPKHRRRIARALNEFELARMIAAAERLDAEAGGFPRTPLLRTLVGTGGRWSEVVACRWGDLAWQPGSLTFRGENTKTEETRTLPLSPELREALADYRELQVRTLAREIEGEDPIFLGPSGKPLRPVDVNVFRDWLYRVLDAAGIPRRDAAGRVFHVHALRHTFATRLARAGVPIQTCAALTGHRTIEILMRVYTHVEAEEARSAIESLPRLPRSGSF